MEENKNKDTRTQHDQPIREEQHTQEKSHVNISRNSTGEPTVTRLDEKSSGLSRRNRNTGLSTKDGLTGSDLDGQVG